MRRQFVSTNLVALIDFPSFSKAQHAGTRSGTALGLPLLLPVSLSEHRDRFRSFLLQSRVDAGKFFLRQLLKIADHVFQFMRQRVRTCGLVVRWATFPSVHARSEERRVGKECRSRW